MQIRTFFFLGLLMFSGCSVHRAGSIDQRCLSIGQSVSDIDRYIEETGDGPNIYLEVDQDDCFVGKRSGCSCQSRKTLQVWMDGYDGPDGHVHAHYLQIPDRR